MADNNLEQLVDFPTRKSATLDLIFSSHPSFIERCKPMPSIGNSDHDVDLLDTILVVRRPKPPRRKIYLWKRADIQGICEDLACSADDFQSTEFDSVHSMWDTFQEQVYKTVDRRVLTKLTLARHTHPWMNGNIRRLIRRKQRAHKADDESKELTRNLEDQQQKRQRQVQKTTTGCPVPSKNSPIDIHERDSQRLLIGKSQEVLVSHKEYRTRSHWYFSPQE